MIVGGPQATSGSSRAFRLLTDEACHLPPLRVRITDTDGIPFARFGDAMAKAARGVWLTIDLRRETLDRLDGKPPRPPPDPHAPTSALRRFTPPDTPSRPSQRPSWTPPVTPRPLGALFADFRPPYPNARGLARSRTWILIAVPSDPLRDHLLMPRLSQRTPGRIGQLAVLSRKAQPESLILEPLPNPSNNRTAAAAPHRGPSLTQRYRTVC